MQFAHRVCFFVLWSRALCVAACGRTSQAHINKAQPVADASADSDGDGIPDNAELRSFDDRQNFKRWFAAIAEMQFYQPQR